MTGPNYTLLVTTLTGDGVRRRVARFPLALRGNRSYAVILLGSLADRTLNLLTLNLPTAR